MSYICRKHQGPFVILVILRSLAAPCPFLDLDGLFCHLNDKAHTSETGLLTPKPSEFSPDLRILNACPKRWTCLPAWSSPLHPIK
jgi:hypothetical protein